MLERWFTSNFVSGYYARDQRMFRNVPKISFILIEFMSIALTRKWGLETHYLFVFIHGHPKYINIKI